MSNITLKPCPFCGGEAEIRKDACRGIFVRCNKCLIGTQPVLHKREKVPIETWNRRIGETPS